MKIHENLKLHFFDDKSLLKMSDTKFANLIFLDVKINEISVSVMFDTGATMTVLSESIVKMIGAQKNERIITAGGNSGNLAESHTVIVENIQVGSSEILNKEVLVIPDEALEFGLDDEGNKFKVKGFLGWDIISLYKWTVDGVNRIFLIEKSYKNDITRNLKWNNFPLIKACWEGENLCFGFDCGNTESMLGIKMIDKLKNLEATIDQSVGADGIIEEDAYITKEFKITIGNFPISLNNIVVLKRNIFGQKHEEMMGLLGADIVQKRKWVLDYPNGHLEIIE